MNKFWTVVGGIFLAVLLTAIVGVVVKNNVPVVKDWVNGWGQEQPAEDENNNENIGDENGEDENITPEEPIPDVNEDENQEPETNLQFFVFENDFAKILISA